jgi:hypothetical protein
MGLNWSKINTVIPHSTDTSLPGLLIFDIAVDPRSNDTIYVAASGGAGDKCEWVKSVDGGQTYQYLLSKVNSESAGHAYSVQIYPDNPDTVFASFGEYIFCYDDINDSVLLLNRGLPGEEIQDISFGSILAGTTTGFYSLGFGEIDEIITNVIKVPENISETMITVYPNPLVTGFNIKFPMDYSEKIEIKIFDILGNETKKMNMKVTNGQNEKIISTSDFVEGTYLLRIFDGNNVFTEKIVIIK